MINWSHIRIPVNQLALFEKPRYYSEIRLKKLLKTNMIGVSVFFWKSLQGVAFHLN